MNKDVYILFSVYVRLSAKTKKMLLLFRPLIELEDIWRDDT